MIRTILLSALTLASLSACAPSPAPTISLAEFYAKNGGRQPFHQMQADTTRQCVDPSDPRHGPTPPRGPRC